MNPRQFKGMEIAQKLKITETPRGWIVPSQSGVGSYLVYKENMTKTVCTCPDCELRNIKCKHQWAVDYFLKVEKTIDSEGNVTITKTEKTIYRQNWKAYDHAQTHEGGLFMEMLSGLCDGIQNKPYVFGRPTMPMAALFFYR